MLARGVLISMSVTACAVIYAVHYQQEYDKAEMHKGVLRDLERRKDKKSKSKSKSKLYGREEL